LEALESRLAEIDAFKFSKINTVLQEFENGPPKGYHFTISPEIQLAIDKYPPPFPLLIENFCIQ
jgi:hypothetical protein